MNVMLWALTDVAGAIVWLNFGRVIARRQLTRWWKFHSGRSAERIARLDVTACFVFVTVFWPLYLVSRVAQAFFYRFVLSTVEAENPRVVAHKQSMERKAARDREAYIAKLEAEVESLRD